MPGTAHLARRPIERGGTSHTSARSSPRMCVPTGMVTIGRTNLHRIWRWPQWTRRAGYLRLKPELPEDYLDCADLGRRTARVRAGQGLV